MTIHAIFFWLMLAGDIAAIMLAAYMFVSQAFCLPDNAEHEI